MGLEKPTLLLVDDDPLICEALSFVLSMHYQIQVAVDRVSALSLMAQMPDPPQLALVDLGLPPNPHRPDEGFRLISELLIQFPQIKILALSGQSDEGNARHARSLGAIDFIGKPCAPESLLLAIARARDWQLVDAKLALRAVGLVGHSPAMARLRQQIGQFANSPFPVLIEGESGSGKELVAQALHQAGAHPKAAYLALNCAALPENLIEATLFGHSKGAFTGAVSARAGYFEEVGEGTLFLDEIGELPLALQSKLLRVLENGEFQRLGETQSRHCRARIVAASNRDLRKMARCGEYRADLYHRLSVLTITTPPLRELGEDKLLLLQYFLNLYTAQLATLPFALDTQAEQVWSGYGFVGNVRELRNIVIRLLAKYPGQTISQLQLLAEFDQENSEVFMPPILEQAKQTLQSASDFVLDDWLQNWERAFFDAAVQLSAGNMSQAAKLLGMHRTTLYSRVESLRQRG